MQKSTPEISGETFILGNFLAYCLSHRLFLALSAMTLIILAAFWTILFHQPRFKSVGTIYVNLTSKSQSFSLSKMNNWVQEQEIINKIYLTEQFFNSNAFKHEFLKMIVSKTESCKSQECLDSLIRFRADIAASGMHLTELEDMITTHLSIFADSQKYMLTVAAESRDPIFSRDLAQLSMNALIDENFESIKKSNLRLGKFLKDQTDQVEVQLSTLEQKLVQLQSAHGIMASPDSETKLTTIYMDQKSKLDELQREKTTLDLFLAELGKDQQDYKASLSSLEQPSYMMLSQAQKRVDLLKYQISLNQSGRNPASAPLASQSALVGELNDYKKLIGSNDRLLATEPLDYLKKLETLWIETKQRRDKVADELQSSQKAMHAADRRYLEMPEFFRAISEVQRNIKISTDLYELLRTRLQETNIQDAEKTNDLSVLSLPDLPRDPAGMSPWSKMVIILLGGPLASFGVLLLAYLMVPHIHSARELENQGLKLVGSWNSFALRNSLILRQAPESFAANKVRESRLRLENLMSLKDHSTPGAKIISLSSYDARDGRTFVTANLAYGFSMADYRVAIVDLNWKGYPHSPYLKFFAATEPTVVELQAEVRARHHACTPNLDYVAFTFDAIDPRDFFDGRKFNEHLLGLREQYDVILIDTPALRGNVEGLLAASLSDAVVLVVNQRKILKGDFEHSLKALRESAAGPVHGLLNFTYDQLRSQKAA